MIVLNIVSHSFFFCTVLYTFLYIFPRLTILSDCIILYTFSIHRLYTKWYTFVFHACIYFVYTFVYNMVQYFIYLPALLSEYLNVYILYTFLYIWQYTRSYTFQCTLLSFVFITLLIYYLDYMVFFDTI